MKGQKILILLSVALITLSFACKESVSVNSQTSQLSQEEKDTRLFKAVSDKDSETVAKFLKQGANPNVKRQSEIPPADSETPLYLAVLGHSPEITELLLQSGANIKNSHLTCQEPQKDCKEYPLLNTSILFGDIPTSEILIKYGAEVTNDLIFSAHDEKTIAFLVAHGVDINYRQGGTKAGDTRLMLSVQLDKPDVINALLKYGANVYLKDAKGVTILELAEYNRFSSTEIVKIIKTEMNKQKKTQKKK